MSCVKVSTSWGQCSLKELYNTDWCYRLVADWHCFWLFKSFLEFFSIFQIFDRPKISVSRKKQRLKKVCLFRKEKAKISFRVWSEMNKIHFCIPLQFRSFFTPDRKMRHVVIVYESQQYPSWKHFLFRKVTV